MRKNIQAVPSLIYVCINHSCLNYYFRQEVIPLVVPCHTVNPVEPYYCPFCRHVMLSELEGAIHTLKEELNLFSS